MGKHRRVCDSCGRRWPCRWAETGSSNGYVMTMHYPSDMAYWLAKNPPPAVPL